MLQPSFTDWYANRRVAQCFTLDQQTGNFNTVQSLYPAKNPYKYALGSSNRFNRSSSHITTHQDLDFSSFIIGEGVVTAAFILTVRWRSTASLNLKECSSSFSVSPSHSMFIMT